MSLVERTRRCLYYVFLAFQRPVRTLACAVIGRRFSSGCKPHPATAPAGSNRSIMEQTKWLKPSDKRVAKYGDSANVQAVKRVNAEQASKRSMRRPTRLVRHRQTKGAA